MRIIDTHTHLHAKQFDSDRKAVLERCAEQAVVRLIEVGYDLESSRKAIALAEEYAHIYAVVGLQPNQIPAAPDNWLAQVRSLAAHPKVVAIGEIGLDYYWNHAPHEQQEAIFREQLALAHELALPVVIHSRDAQADTLRILRDAAIGQPGVMHSFIGGWEFAQGCLDVGFMLSFSGPVTFPKTVDIQHVARHAPLDMILTETDSPYLSPEPFRGKRNEPARVRLVAQQLANLRNISLEALSEHVWANAARVFTRMQG